MDVQYLARSVGAAAHPSQLYETPVEILPAAPSAIAASAAAAVENLHPTLWRAHRLGRAGSAVRASGFDELDRQLPGGGWPARTLTELLLPHPGVGELRLLAPSIAAASPRCTMWFDPPAAPCAWALAALGIDLKQLVVVSPKAGVQRPASPPRPAARRAPPAADMLWALEQALKSGQLGAVLAWLPARLPTDALRRLQMAAASHDGPVFLLREQHGSTIPPSPATLRLQLASEGADVLRVHIFKRRGPPMAGPLSIELPLVCVPPVPMPLVHEPVRAEPAVPA
jgi:protein ImuA